MNLSEEQMLRICVALQRDIEWMEEQESDEHAEGMADEFWSDRIDSAKEAHRIVNEELRNAY